MEQKPRGPYLTTALNQWKRQVAIRLSADRGSKVLFDHHGDVDHTVVHRLLATAEAACMAANDDVSLRKRLFNVLVEGLENTFHHAHETFRASTYATLLDSHEGYRMMLGNLLPPEKATGLADRVSVLNGLSDTELKARFRSQLASDERASNGGAGLGLLTMVRKSARPILTRTRRIDGSATLFVMELCVPRS